MCDDNPAPPEDVIAYAAELLGMPVPEAIDFDKADMSPMAKSFYAENKKVSNEKIKKILSWSPQFKNYKIGISEILRQSND